MLDEFYIKKKLINSLSIIYIYLCIDNILHNVFLSVGYIFFKYSNVQGQFLFEKKIYIVIKIKRNEFFFFYFIAVYSVILSVVLSKKNLINGSL